MTRLASLGAVGCLVALTVVSVAAQAVQGQEPKSLFFEASDGAKIHYLRAGDEGSWVVLLHGYRDTASRMWFRTGIAPALAENHRVVAIDHLNHGESDRPEPRGVGRASDVVELMELLGIERAHIHGYSMGGAMVATLLYEVPDRFITAGFGGSGVRETDEELRSLASSFDVPQPPRARRPASPPTAGEGSESATEGRTEGASAEQRRPGSGLSSFRRPLDLSKVKVPVLAINGELDAPYAKTLRLWRELEIFQNVVLPGLTHLTAIAVGGPMPQQYIDSMAGFIDTYDEK